VNSEFELIRYNDNLPARIEIKQGEINTPYHWHKEIELVYVMDGAVTIKINTQDRSLHADEFVLMNSAENHSLSSEDAKCLILDISYEFAEQFDSSLYSSSFKIVSGSGAERRSTIFSGSFRGRRTSRSFRTCGSMRSSRSSFMCCSSSASTKTPTL
ncbi:MAG: cupin domain-containing protein, partial [Ruminococcus sp.]|nr:cupin domain-containing protein [Ruminococcus sp.]